MDAGLLSPDAERLRPSAPIPGRSHQMVVQGPPMPDIGEDRSLSEAIAAQTIGDKASRFVFEPMQQSLEETLRGAAVPPVLHQMSSTTPCWSTACHR